MPPLVSYNEHGDVEDSDEERAAASPNAAVANSDATASEIGSPVHVVPPDIANLLRGAVAVSSSIDAEGEVALSEQEAQAASEPLSQETDYGAAFSPVHMSALVDTDGDALHVELASSRKQNEQLQYELKKAHATIAELKRRLDVNSEKRANISKECSELRGQLLPKRLEVAKAAAHWDSN